MFYICRFHSPGYFFCPEKLVIAIYFFPLSGASYCKYFHYFTFIVPKSDSPVTGACMDEYVSGVFLSVRLSLFDNIC